MYAPRTTDRTAWHSLGVDATRPRRRILSPFAVYPLLGLLIVVVALLVYVRFRSQTQQFARQMATDRMELAKNAKELVNLHVLLEQYTSGDYILGAVRRYHMGLRPAFPGQVRRIPAPLVAGPLRPEKSRVRFEAPALLFARNK